MGTIVNVAKRASAAIHDLEMAADKLRELRRSEMNDEELGLWLGIFKDMENAQKKMCYIIMQDLEIESYSDEEL